MRSPSARLHCLRPAPRPPLSHTLHQLCHTFMRRKDLQWAGQTENKPASKQLQRPSRPGRSCAAEHRWSEIDRLHKLEHKASSLRLYMGECWGQRATINASSSRRLRRGRCKHIAERSSLHPAAFQLQQIANHARWDSESSLNGRQDRDQLKIAGGQAFPHSWPSVQGMATV